MESRFPAPPAYDEGVIVILIEKIYRLLILMCYLSSNDVFFAPAGVGHAINETLSYELGLDPRVVSLMKRLPYHISPPHTPKGIFPGTYESYPLQFTRDSDIRILDPLTITASPKMRPSTTASDCCLTNCRFL
jgi:hypothetical protein